MRALHIQRYGRFPVLTTYPIPTWQANSIIARVHYAPVNPSDINFYQGRYGIKKDGFPIVGFQGSGVIQQAENQSLIGRKVSFLANMSNGTHATHIKTTLKETIIWPDEVDLAKVCTSWINPFSCIGLTEAIDQHKPQTILISGVTSQISSMIIRLIVHKWPNLRIVGIARNESKAEQLKKIGLHTFIPMQEALEKQLKNVEGKTLFYDCIGGNFAGKIFNKLPKESVFISYGRLSGEPLGQVDLGSLYYQSKIIKGFWLNNWFATKTEHEIENFKFDVIRHFDTFYDSEIRNKFKLDKFMEAYHASIKEQSKGKILLDMSN